MPSGSFLSKDVLRGMAAWACWSSGWHCRRSGVPGTGEALETGCRAGVGTRCHVVFLLKGVLYSQGVPSLSSLYSTMGIRQSSEQPLRGEPSSWGWMITTFTVTDVRSRSIICSWVRVATATLQISTRRLPWRRPAFQAKPKGSTSATIPSKSHGSQAGPARSSSGSFLQFRSLSSLSRVAALSPGCLRNSYPLKTAGYTLPFHRRL